MLGKKSFSSSRQTEHRGRAEVAEYREEERQCFFTAPTTMASVGSGFDLPLRTLRVATALTLFIGYVHCQTTPGPTSPSPSCSEDLGIASGLLSSQYFTASSSYSAQYVGATYTYQPGDARAGKMRGYGGWAPVTGSLEEYLQIDYGTEVSITSMAIHGFQSMHESKGRYVTSFNIYISTGNGVLTSVAPSFNLTYFSGNVDSWNAQNHTFSPALKATVIWLSNFTTATSVLPGLRIGFRGCNPPPVFADLQACDTALGVSSGVVNNSLITASSVYSLSYAAYYARLYKSFGNGGFCASNGFTASDYLQVDLGQVRLVSAIASQGIEDSFLTSPYYTSRYSVRYGLVPGGVNLTDLKTSGHDLTHVFSGNTDKNTAVKQYFAAPIRARFIRMFDFSPRSTHSDPCMRIEIYGCTVPKLTTATPSPSTAASATTEPGIHFTTATVVAVTGTVPPVITDATNTASMVGTLTTTDAALSSTATETSDTAVHQVSASTGARVGTDSQGNPLILVSSTVSKATEEGTKDSINIVALGAGIGAGVAFILIIMFIVLVIKCGRRGRKDVQDGGKGASKYNDSDGFDQLPAYSSLHIYANPANRQQQTSCTETAAMDTAAATTAHDGTALHGNSGRNSLATAGGSVNPAYTAEGDHAPPQPAMTANSFGGNSPQGPYSDLRHSVNYSTKAGGHKEPSNPQDVYLQLHKPTRETANQYESPKRAGNQYESAKGIADQYESARGTTNQYESAKGTINQYESARGTTNQYESARGTTNQYESARGTTNQYESARGTTNQYESARGTTNQYESARGTANQYESARGTTNQYESARGTTNQYESARGTTNQYESARGTTNQYESARGTTSQYESPRGTTSQYESARGTTNQYESTRGTTNQYESAKGTTNTYESARKGRQYA
ncbi:uncharacterized protein LOC135828371 [Sycon ciliatum]|uniref:uncharacterized protein LOC135828371 n=1 Tax=Sycon ciliatum TaxID=27933 RepID=UPI0031F6310B